MALNFPGPYDVRIVYVPTLGGVQDIPHEMKVNVSLVEPAVQNDVFGNYDINDINGATTVDLATVVEGFLTALMDIMKNDTDVISVELWKYPVAQSTQSQFWSSYIPTANVGTRVVGTISGGQDIYVFRSEEGNVMKLSPMEGVIVAGSPLAYAGLTTESAAIVDFILDGDGATYSAPFLARDTSYPKSFIREYPGINEHLWKRRNGR